ncbi:hypothetical protein BDW22DRAFT_904252 [Trametopsis cervina]|nr:hypothetical protein BDW22DRAFT_904252 [Trametopsis cervina]
MLASVMVPGTPPLNGPMNTYRPPSTQPSPSLSDDSAMELPDFPYFTNSQGEFVRMKTPSPDHSPSPSGGSRRASLSRSESAPCVIDQSPAPGSVPAARQFARVSSGPIPTVPTISTPAMASTYFPRSTGLSSTARKFTSAPRRVVRQEDRDAAERDQGKENGDAMPLASSSTSTRPLAEVMPVPQRTVGANGRPVMPVPSRSVRRKPEPITEVDDVDEIGHHQPRHSLSTSTGIRPRRSASLSDAAPEDFPATYMRSANIGARRVTLEEKLKREREITLEEAYNVGLRGSSEAQIQESRKTPSPTHVATQPAALRGLAHYHQRKESDTMVGSDSNSSGEHGREHRYAYVNGDHLSAAGMYRDKHSPTTVERPVYPDPMSSYAHQSGKPWATDSGRDSAGEEARPDNQYHKQAAKAAMSQQRITQASRRAPSVPPQTQQQVVNGKSFVVCGIPLFSYKV